MLHTACNADHTHFVAAVAYLESLVCPRAQSRVEEPEDESGALLDVAKHQGCVQHQVWDKMLKIINYCKQSQIINKISPKPLIL